MDKKTGVYICTGCGIGESLDIEGVSQIKSDIENEGVNTVVIAACSSRVNYDVFEFGPSILLERTNLREQITWCHPANDEDTQMMAEDSLRMSLAKAKHIQLPESFQGENMVKTILVVGGG